MEQKVLSWNVEQVSISGRGIEVCQMGSQYKKDKGQPGGAQIEDEYAWRVSFPLGDIQDVWVSEGERQGSALPVITIRFSIVAAPDSRDASKLLECKTSGTLLVVSNTRTFNVKSQPSLQLRLRNNLSMTTVWWTMSSRGIRRPSYSHNSSKILPTSVLRVVWTSSELVAGKGRMYGSKIYICAFKH